MATTDIGRAVPLMRGEYSPLATYELNDIVTLNGSMYWHYSHTVTTNVAPQATDTWMLVLDLTAAEEYISRAESAAETAEQAKDDAVTAKTAAETASTSASGSSSAASAAQTAAEAAKDAAIAAKDDAVSAKTDAERAKTAAQSAATAASGSATAANSSAGNAEYYAGEASTAATTATGKADEASASAATASSAATTATGAKDTAVSSAAIATTKAGEASTSATSAASSAAAAQAVKDSIPPDYTSLSNDVADVKTQLSDDEIGLNPTLTAGYINQNGAITASEAYGYSGAIHLLKGQIISVKTASSSGNVSVISGYASNPPYNPLVISTTNDRTTYKFEATADIDVVVCVRTLSEYSVSLLTADIFYNKIGFLNGKIEKLPKVNLFDKSESIKGKYIDSTGAETSSPNWYITNYIPVIFNQPMIVEGVVTTNEIIKAAYYNSEKTLISVVDAIQNGILAWLPENIAYIRFSVHKNDVDNFGINVYKLLPYEERNEIVNSDRLYGIKNPVYLENVLSGAYWDTESQTKIENSGWKCTELIPVKRGDFIHLANTSRRPYVLYSTDGTTVLDYTVVAVDAVKYHYTYIVPEDGNIGFNVAATNIDTYRIYINGNRYIISAGLKWLDSGTWSTWAGKTGIMFGDSLVSGQQDDSPEGGAYCRRLKEHLDLLNCVNKGMSGCPIADGTPNGDGTVTTVLSIADYSGYDLVIIAGGTNDFKLNVPIGTLENVGGTFNRQTFYGALQKIAEYLMTKKANIRVCLWTPLQRNNSGYDIYYTNSAGHKLSDYCEAIKTVGKLYSFPVIDMYSISGVNMQNLTYYTADGLHLNGNGYDIVSYIGAKQINAI